MHDMPSSTLVTYFEIIFLNSNVGGKLCYFVNDGMTVLYFILSMVVGGGVIPNSSTMIIYTVASM